MNRQDRQLLLKDLCARLPYGVKIQFDNGNICETREMDLGSLHDFKFNGATIKPYLRPLSSMTEGEKKELINIRPYLIDKNYVIIGVQCNSFIQASECQDWLNEHHFDYRGLIPMGLALEAPEDMYKL